MLVMASIKWRGTNEELEPITKMYKECADGVEGCKYLGRYSSWQTEYNWAYLYEVEEMGQFQKAMANMSPDFKRDYEKFPAFVVEFWSGPM
jgi:hypothetical protein